MMRYIATFRENESGAITVDWVVLTAAMATLAAAAILTLDTLTGGVGSSIAETLSNTKFE